MAIKKGAKERHNTPRRRRRPPSPPVEGRNRPSKQELMPRIQRVTRSQAGCQSEIPTGKVTSKHKSTKALLNDKAAPCPSSNETVQTPIKEQALENCDGEKPASEQNQLQPLPLTNEGLHLFDNSCRSYGSSSMASDNTEESKATTAYINAYDPGYETALNDRFVFLYKGKPKAVPKDVAEIRAAVFAMNKGPKPPKENAGLVRSLLSEISGEPEMVSQILPKVVPLEQLQMNDQKEVAVDQYWRRCLALDPDLKPSFSTPKQTWPLVGTMKSSLL
ncbi:hypothetical protein MMC21_006209 [Puttea exsequens]|nr:hypothetical protein [Puttea exsequens]